MPSRKPQSKANPVGRPPAEAGSIARLRLIEVAAAGFAAQGYEATSLKQVAEGAGVTPAMIAYYFSDKSGLLEAVVVEGLERLFGALQQAVLEHEPGGFVPGLIRHYLDTISADPWIPQLLMREVVSRDTPLRALFIDRFASRALELIPPRVLEEIQAGRLDRDLDVRYTLLSLLGMCVFPFLAHPVLGRLLDYELDPAFGTAYADHTVRLFGRGTGGQV